MQGGEVSLLDNLPGREAITGTETLVNVSDTIEGAGSIENTGATGGAALRGAL